MGSIHPKLHGLIVLSLLFMGGCVSSGKSKQIILPEIAVHGHRGSRGTHPENTMPALEEAVSAGADALEFDLQLAKGNVPVIAHDPEISPRLCRDLSGNPVKKAIAINTLSVEELSKFDCGSIFQERFPNQKLVPQTSIPTLESVLQWVLDEVPEVALNIEIKMDAQPKPDPEVFVRSVIELLKKYELIERSNIQSFDFSILKAAKKLAPDLKLAALFESETDFCEKTIELGVKIAAPYYKLITLENVKQCHAHSIAVIPWTVNESSDWKRLLDIGVDAIITDFPRDLVEFLNKRIEEKLKV